MNGFVARLARPTLGRLLWLLVPICLSPLHYAHAYLDPGSGSYIIQMVIGLVFGAAYVVKGTIAKAVQWVKERLRKRK